MEVKYFLLLYKFDNKNISEHLQIYLFKANLNSIKQDELLDEGVGPGRGHAGRPGRIGVQGATGQVCMQDATGQGCMQGATGQGYRAWSSV